MGCTKSCSEGVLTRHGHQGDCYLNKQWMNTVLTTGSSTSVKAVLTQGQEEKKSSLSNLTFTSIFSTRLGKNISLGHFCQGMIEKKDIVPLILGYSLLSAQLMKIHCMPCKCSFLLLGLSASFRLLVINVLGRQPAEAQPRILSRRIHTLTILEMGWLSVLSDCRTQRMDPTSSHSIQNKPRSRDLLIPRDMSPCAMVSFKHPRWPFLLWVCLPQLMRMLGCGM